MITCPICGNDGWESADQFRHKKEGMMYCTKCAFVSYPERVKKKKELADYYEGDDYRRCPTFGNLATGQTKLQYHANFLQETLNEWKKEKKEKVVLDVGTAFGLFLAWLKRLFPDWKYYGTELTESFRRVAYHEYKLNLTPQIDESIKYDLISTYKVLEHIPDPHLELKKYNKILKDDGLLYISVPIWYETMCNFGLPGFSLEYYYHPDHINVWSKKMFEKILHESGFEIIKEDHITYDSTYLCKKTKEIETVELEPKEKILDNLRRIKESYDCVLKHEHKKAIELWPNNPTAHHGNYEMNRVKYHQEGFKFIKSNVVEKALKDCKNHPEAIGFAADIHIRYDDYSTAYEFFKFGLHIRPNYEPYLKGIAVCLQKISEITPDPKEKQRLLKEAIAVMKQREATCLGAKGDSITYIYKMYSMLPIGDKK